MDNGNVPEWIAAVATLAGFLAAFLQLRANLRDARAARQLAHEEEEVRREAMARAVGVKVSWQPGPDGGPPSGPGGPMPVDVEVQNASPYPISGAVLELATEDVPAEIVYGTILPGEHLKDRHEVRRSQVVFGELIGGATLIFTDTFGNHWARSTHDLERREQSARTC